MFLTVARETMTRILFAVVSYSKAKGKFGIMECVVCSRMIRNLLEYTRVI